MRNRKGFTLVELLSVIVLIGLLIGIGIPGINRISKNISKKSLETKTKQIEQAGTLWGQDNLALLQGEKCTFKIDDVEYNDYSCQMVSIKDLIDDDYLDGDNNNKILKNPLNNKNFYGEDDVCDDAVDDDCCVFIYKKNNRVYSYFGSSSCTKVD